MYAKKITNYKEYLDEIVFSNNVFSFQSLQRRLKKLHRKDCNRYREFTGLTTELETYIKDDIVNWRGKNDVSETVSNLVHNWADYISDIDKLNKIRTTMLENYAAQLSSTWEMFEEEIETEMDWANIRPFLDYGVELSEKEIELGEKAAKQQRKAEDQKLYEDAKKADSPEAYRSYLQNCTECVYKTEAKKRIQEIKNEQERLLDEELFKEAEAQNCVESYQKYLSNCTLCSYKPEAEQRVKELKHGDLLAEESDLFNKVKKMDTVEAYEQYLQHSKLRMHKVEAEKRIVYLKKNIKKSPVQSKKCPKCGKEYTPNYTICLKDGTQLIDI